MSLYDDIEPTVKRSRTFEVPDDAIYTSVERKNDGSRYAAPSMLAPRTIIPKKPTDPRLAPTPSILSSIAVPQLHSMIPSSQSQFTQQQPVIDMDALKNQIKAKRMELDKPIYGSKGLFKTVPAPSAPLSAQNPPSLQARKVDMNRVKEITIVPTDMLRDESEYLFDEVHIIDEYNPSKPNEYNDVMKSIGCNPAFGEEVDDSRLERMIINEIINGKAERIQRTPSPDPDERRSGAGPSVIANIMAKMGYTEGSGLGKHGQGMSSALKVEKKAGHGGRIVSEVDEVMMSVGLNPDSFTKPITNVLLLRNIYTSYEIPEDYDQELRPELSQYGQLRRLYLHHSIAEEDPFEQVRVFAEYANKASAIRAYAGLNQRFFSQRPIKADFYPIEKFALGQFGEQL